MTLRSRRTVLKALAASFCANAVPAFGQAKIVVRRVGFLSGYKALDPASPVWLRNRLKAQGFEEGRNLVIERCYVDGALEKLDACVRQFIEHRVDVIVANANAAIDAARRATRSIPIVMHYGIAPVEAGFIQSFAKPGGNITGNAFHTADTGAKLFDLMLEAFPGAKRCVMLWNASRPGYHAYERVLTRIAQTRRVALDLVSVEAPAELAGALRRIEALRPDILLVANDVAFAAADKDIAAFALGRKLPSIGTDPDWVDAGGLLYYGPNDLEPIERTPRYVVKLLQGANPAELPVEQPSTYRLTINAGTARALGYAISPSLLIRADKVVDGTQ